MDDDFDRYESSAGWEPEDPYKKQREAVRKQQLLEPDPLDSMLETRPASKWILPGSKQRPPIELFGPLWREGEVAVLFGETGVGKSILAVQIAEAIATGRNTAGREYVASPIRTPQSAIRSRKVLLIDFELTQQQFTERYSAPSPLPGKLPVSQKFRFQRAAMTWDGYLPPAFKDVHEFMLHSIFHEVDRLGSRVVIIDNISYLAKNVSSHTSCLRIMKTLKQWAAREGLSILVLANSKTDLFRDPHSAFRNRKARPLGLSDLAGSRHLAELADSVFAIGSSTFGPEYRYVKHLKSRNAPLLPEAGWTSLLGGRGGGSHDASNVLTYRLERMEIGKLKKQNDSADSQLSILNSQFPPTPFLGLTYLGEAAENDHLRDYTAEARETQRRERADSSRDPQSAIRSPQSKSSRSALLAGLMDGTYSRYLKG